MFVAKCNKLLSIMQIPFSIKHDHKCSIWKFFMSKIKGPVTRCCKVNKWFLFNITVSYIVVFKKSLCNFNSIICCSSIKNKKRIDAAINIRKFLPSCKILLFSGQAATADLLENARARGHQFEILAKPVHPQDLLAKLRD